MVGRDVGREWAVSDNLLTYLGRFFWYDRRDLFPFVFSYLSAINKTVLTSIKHILEKNEEDILLEERSVGNGDLSE